MIHRIAIVYESVHGHTKHVAEAIAAGARTLTTVSVGDVDYIRDTTLARASLLIVGAPRHYTGLSLPIAHTDDIQQARETDNEWEPSANEFGVREWLTNLPSLNIPYAAFETRQSGINPWLSAAHQIHHALQAAGFTPAAPPESFQREADDTIKPAELLRAHEWGRQLATTIDQK